jgi:PAS domain S-box-containing protein
MDSFAQILQEQKEYFESLLNSIPEDLVVFNKEYRFEFVNTKALPDQVIREWVIGKTDAEYLAFNNYPPKIAEVRKKYFEKALKEKITVEFKEVIEEDNGKIVYHLRRFCPITKNGSPVEKVISYGIDISNLSIREINIQKRANMLSSMVNNLNLFMIIIDANLTITFTNKKWLEVFGLKSNQITQYFCEGEIQFLASFSRIMNNGVLDKEKVFAVLVNSLNGDQFILEYSIVPFFGADEEYKSWVVCFTNVTEHIHVAENLKKIILKEHNLNELKKSFVEMVSHELRNPLSVILSNSDLIDQKAKQVGLGENAFTKKHTKRITDQIDIMTKLLTNILEVRKIESDNLISKPIKLFPLEMFTLLIKEFYSPWKDGRRLAFSFKGLNRALYFDPFQLKYILINLIDNAFKYSKDKIEPRLRVNIRTDSWSILIIDHGIGVPKNDLVKLFKSFVRGSNVTDIEGTGVGLMIVKYFMNLNDGNILVRSTIDKGTIFCLHFNNHNNSLAK